MSRIVQKIPFLRLVTVLVSGIISGSFFESSLLSCWLLSFFVLITLFVINRYYRYAFTALFGVLVCILYFNAGLFIYTLYNREPVFYDKGIFSSTVMEIPVEKKNSVQAVLKIHSVKNKGRIVRTNEKIIALFEKCECALNLEPGQKVIFNRAPLLITSDNNPFQFDYKKYLAGKRIFRQIFLSEGQWTVDNSDSFYEPVVFAGRLRMSLLRLYRMSDLSEKNQNVLAALTLGYKEAIDSETKHIFTSSGTIHVLAVSGLHVGIVYMVISFCFGFLKFSGPGRTFFLFISLGSLWFFALLTGLSPSVSRAALMFSFVVVGQNIRRRANIYNTLTASAFFLLIINPNNLFDAGFQFSYSAVFGIVFMQPRIEKLIDFRYRILKYFWSLLSVSVAAQVATFPLSVYYFDQFPAYFWISNLVIIPAVTVLVPVGFMLMAFCWLPAIFKILTLLAEIMVNVLFSFLKLIEQMPYAMIKISMSEAEIFFLYCLLLTIFLLISNKNLTYVKYILLSFFMVLIVSLVIKVAAIYRKEIIVYNVQGITMMHLITGFDNYIVSTEKVNRDDYCYRMAVRTAMKLKLKSPVFLTTEQKFKDDHICILNNLLNFEGRIICVLNKPFYLPADLQPDIFISTLKKLPLHVKSMQRDVTLVTKMRIKDNFTENINVHNMDDRGAYIEKW